MIVMAKTSKLNGLVDDFLPLDLQATSLECQNSRVHSPQQVDSKETPLEGRLEEIGRRGGVCYDLTTILSCS